MSRRSRRSSSPTPTIEPPAGNGLARAALALVLVVALALAALFGEAFQANGTGSTAGEITLAELPPEGRQTLALIKRGGPFPYSRDGIVFQNLEGLLPDQRRGYYREYTVPTPGLNHRGARRIVAGRVGEYWYTADHYRSFKRIRE